MHGSRTAMLVRRLLALLALVGGSAGAAGAQLQITFFDTYPGTAPSPTDPFPGGAVLCTAAAAGSASGFSLNFANAAAVDALCGPIGGNPASQRINNSQSFGARIVGSLVAPAAGTYEFFLNADDGNVLTINCITYRTDWFDKAGGPGLIGNIPLLAGANPFIVDYYQGPCCGAFIELEARGNVVITPPAVVPEPATVALTATGLAVLTGIAGRRRRA